MQRINFEVLKDDLKRLSDEEVYDLSTGFLIYSICENEEVDYNDSKIASKMCEEELEKRGYWEE